MPIFVIHMNHIKCHNMKAGLGGDSIPLTQNAALARHVSTERSLPIA